MSLSGLQVYNYGFSLLGEIVLSVTVFGFRRGSVIADTIVSIDQAYSEDPPVDATKLIHSLNNVGSLTIGQSQVAVEGVTVANEQSDREYFNVIELVRDLI